MARQTKRTQEPRPTAKLSCGPGRTKQSFSGEADVNNIMAKYMKTGTLEWVRSATPSYEDYSNVTDYFEAALVVKQAEASFLELPARLREAFHHNPGEMLEFLETGNDAQAKLDEIDQDPRPKNEEDLPEISKTVPTRAEQRKATPGPSPIQGGESPQD